MSKVLSETNFALLTLHEEKFILELTWKKHSPPEIYKETIMKAMEIASHKVVKYFLSDIRKEGVVPVGNLRWLNENIISKAVDLGVKKVAIVLNEDLFSNIYAELLEKNLAENNIILKIFSDKKDAYKWFN